jgi:hypothetical protein
MILINRDRREKLIQGCGRDRLLEKGDFEKVEELGTKENGTDEQNESQEGTAAREAKTARHPCSQRCAHERGDSPHQKIRRDAVNAWEHDPLPPCGRGGSLLVRPFAANRLIAERMELEVR